MNVVSEDELWIHYHTDFPMERLRIVNGQEKDEDGQNELKEKRKEREREKEEERPREGKEELAVSQTRFDNCPVWHARCLAFAEPRHTLLGVRRQGVLAYGPFWDGTPFYYLSLYERIEGGRSITQDRHINLFIPTEDGPQELHGRKVGENRRDVTYFARGPWQFVNVRGKVFGLDVREIDVAIYPMASLKNICAAAWLLDYNSKETGGVGSAELADKISSLQVPEDIKVALRSVRLSLLTEWG